jgi:uncharacterized membrane protein
MRKEDQAQTVFARIGRFEAHHRQLIALPLAILGFLVFPSHSLLTRLIECWNIYAAALLLSAWAAILTADPRYAQRTAKLQDSSRAALFVFVLAAACMSLLAVLFILREHKLLHTSFLGLHLGLSILAVVESWLLIHTVFALRYAHAFYRGEAEKEVEGPGGGLLFPDEKKPNYMDFAYFSFVIGMTFQVSDVQITSRSIRRLALLQGLLSFAFNTAIIALSINVMSALFVG